VDYRRYGDLHLHNINKFTTRLIHHRCVIHTDLIKRWNEASHHGNACAPPYNHGQSRFVHIATGDGNTYIRRNIRRGKKLTAINSESEQFVALDALEDDDCYVERNFGIFQHRTQWKIKTVMWKSSKIRRAQIMKVRVAHRTGREMQVYRMVTSEHL
jgi:hypothetical protein